MAKRKEEEVKKGSPEYMTTYGDMMTLLLCFFVLLFASSTLDMDKFQAIANSFSERGILSTGVSIGERQVMGSGLEQLPQIQTIQSREEQRRQQEEELRKMASDFKTYFAKNNLSSQIDVELTDDSVILRLGEGVLFDSGSAILKTEALTILEMMTEQLLKYADNSIKIEGHTDNVPIRTAQFPSNWELSSARAISVLRYYIETQGFDPTRFSHEGFGEYKPIADNATAEGRAQNRRIEIHVMAKSLSSY